MAEIKVREKELGITYGRITEEGLARMRARIGVPYYPERYNEEATKDGIRHFVNSIGDRNPLFRDENYALKTRFGGIVAPPIFLYGVCAPQGMDGLPGVHAFYCACEWEWLQYIRRNDTMTCVDMLTDMEEKQGKMGGTQFLQHGMVTYRNQRNELVGKCHRMTMRVDRKEAAQRGKYSDIKTYKYTDEEMEAIYRAYDDELANIRGRNPRYWEDVKVGDVIKPIPKGPLSMTDMQAFYAGFGIPGWGITEAHGIRLSFMRKHPAWATRSESGSLEPMADVHSGDDVAAAIGVPQAYDLGVQRFSWLGSMMTNWIGDDGFLKKLSAQARLFNLFGDTQWMSGKVTKKYKEGKECAVDFEIWCDNQRGERTTTGEATVWLPSKEEGRLPLDD
ncbi:MAG: hypothetical protein AUJ48_02420 [Deltaproteobacteria bacterium CG1_02_45_11]|nr:MAG: hypothetical protein AUJ48_02420 [Deltaproteobacteria bacterium CG1_02_45_11]